MKKKKKSIGNVIIINKTVSQEEPGATGSSRSRSRSQKTSAGICTPQDLVEKELLGQIHGLLMTLNPDAKIYQTQRLKKEKIYQTQRCRDFLSLSLARSRALSLSLSVSHSL